MDRDEPPTHAKLDKVARLKPAFKVGGSITAANASGIADGAAALVLMRESRALHEGLKPLARVCASAIHAHEPAWFATAPVGAVQKTLSLAGWTSDGVDLWEINEAFAAVPLLAIDALKLPHDRVNVHGGACSMGHPIGASGARIVVTLIGALKQRGLRSGVAALCIGGGEAAALALEVI
jgi:acetyl-CoA C-acetyltransferase